MLMRIARVIALVLIVSIVPATSGATSLEKAARIKGLVVSTDEVAVLVVASVGTNMVNEYEVVELNEEAVIKTASLLWKALADDPNTTVEISSEDLEAVTEPTANGMQLYFQGKLKVTGNPMLAIKLQNLFALS